MDDTISRQAAIDAILHNQEVYSNNFGNDPIDKYTIAIIDNDAQTIAQLPSAQPDVPDINDGDMISRRAVQEMIDRIGGMYPYRQIGNRDSYSQYNEAWTDAINRVDAELNSLPSVQPEPERTMEEFMYGQDMGNPEDGSL